MAKELEGGKLGSEKSKKRKYLDSEKDTAEKLGGRAVPASGAGIRKGDISLDNFLIEQKETSLNSLMVTRDWLVKIDREAYGEGKIPALLLKFEKIAAGVPNEWVCIPAEVFAQCIIPKVKDGLD